MIYRKLLLPIVLLICHTLYCQTAENNLLKWAQINPIEKVYLHLDRESYTAGQTIWLKGYFLSDFIPSSKSTSLTVELLDQNGRVIVRNVFPAFMSESFGQVELPGELASGTYQLRAYSPIMLNQEGFYFSKKITIFGRQPKAGKAADRAVNITFFPEGGNLVATLMNNVAFKAVDENGLPVNLSLEIRNQKNELISTVSGSHDGMGLFSIVPQTQEVYHAVIPGDPASKKYVLPAATTRGVTINVRSSPKGKVYKVEQLPGDDTFKAAYMIGQMQNTVVFSQTFAGNKNIYGGTIQTSNLLSGILHITIFNKDHMPLAQRLTFIDNKEYILPATFTADTVDAGERKRNRFSIELPDTIIGNFSVSVTDADYETTESREQNIFSYFLLSSDLKGYINNPAAYFSANGVAKPAALELVMMTNGWTRFRWEDAVKNTLPPPVYKDNAFITLKGRVTLEGRKKPFANSELIYFMTPRDTSLRKFGIPKLIKTDSAGSFEIDSMVFFGPMNILFSDIKGNKSKYIKVTLGGDSLYRNYHPPLVDIPFKDTFSVEAITKMTDHYNDYLREQGLMLENVTVRTRVKTKEEQLEERYASGLFAGGINTRILDLTDEKTGLNIFEYIQGRIAGINVRRDAEGDYQITYRDGGLGNNTVALYLDEMQTDAAFIEAVPVSQIAYVKLINNFVGASGSGAALAIYMKKGAELSAATESATDIVPYKGYEIIKEFYSPDYSAPSPENANADNRLTLLWLPAINLSHVSPKIPVIFYNNDRTKRFKIVAEGVTNDGRFLMLEKIVNP